MAWTHLKNIDRRRPKQIFRVDKTRKDERGKPGFSAGEMKL